MEQVVKALKTLKRCTASELAKYLGREPREVIIDLKFLEDAYRADCVNGIWRSLTRTKPFKPEGAA